MAGLKSSPRLKRLIETSTMLVSDKRLQEMKNELLIMHKSRKTRFLKIQDVLSQTQVALIKAVNQSIAYRSRCVDILEECSNFISELEYSAEKVNMFLTANYSKELSKFRTAGERQNYVWSFMSPVYDKVQNIKAVKELCTLIMEDIDQAGWSVERIIKVLNITSKPEKHM